MQHKYTQYTVVLLYKLNNEKTVRTATLVFIILLFYYLNRITYLNNVNGVNGCLCVCVRSTLSKVSILSSTIQNLSNIYFVKRILFI